MGMPYANTEWTAEMVNALPEDGKRYEVIDGELFVTPAPLLVHQKAVAELYLLLAPYAKALKLDPLFAPAAVRFSERREVQPDVLVMPRMPDGKFAVSFGDVGKLLLAVEVVSPSSGRTDRFTKRRLYQEENVLDYWIIDTESRTVECWQPQSEHAETVVTTLYWQPLASHAPLAIDLPAYFREVFGE